jgi:hypothetical protein
MNTGMRQSHQRRQRTPTDLPTGGTSSTGKVSLLDTMLFSRQMHTLLKAGCRS